MKKEIKIYIVNLAHDILKKKHITNLMNKYSLNYEFFSGIYGKNLSQKDIDNVYDEKEAQKTIGRPLSRGEIGCALSHMGALKKIIDSGDESAIILEDDVDFDGKLVNFIHSIDEIPKTSDIVLLGHHSIIDRRKDTVCSLFYSHRLDMGIALKKPTETAMGTYGYFVKRSGAIKLLDGLKKISRPLDHLIGSRRHTNLYASFPSIVKINDELTKLSNIAADSGSRARLSLWSRLKDRAVFHLTVITREFTCGRDK